MSGTSRTQAPTVERIGFVSKVALKGKARKALNRLRKRKGGATIGGNKIDSKTVGIIEVIFGPDRGLEQADGGFLVRVTSGDQVRDFGKAGDKKVVSDAQGRRRLGLAVIDEGDLVIVVPGGLREPFMVDVVTAGPDGVVTGQHIGGPGSQNAGIPVGGSFAPVLDCVGYSVGIDFDSSSDGIKYDLLGLDLVIDTTLLPPFATAEEVTLDMTSTPVGQRAETAGEIEFEGLMPSSTIRRAIAVEIDLSQESLQGASGYWLGERPFDITRLDMNVDIGNLEPFDADAAIMLLTEAGWSDPTGDGEYTYEATDLVAEIRRQAGRGQTSGPLNYADPACGLDPNFQSLQDVCPSPTGAAIDIWTDALGEPPDQLNLLPDLIPGDLFGCTVLGPGNQLLAAFAMSDAYGLGEAFDPAWLDWSSGLDCTVDDILPAPGSATASRVADCDSSNYDIWADDSKGAWAWVLMSGSDITPAHASSSTATFAALDSDGDGTTERLDADLDGDGAPDELDFTIRSVHTFLSPGVLTRLRVVAISSRAIASGPSM